MKTSDFSLPHFLKRYVTFLMSFKCQCLSLIAWHFQHFPSFTTTSNITQDKDIKAVNFTYSIFLHLITN